MELEIAKQHEPRRISGGGGFSHFAFQISDRTPSLLCHNPANFRVATSARSDAEFYTSLCIIAYYTMADRDL
jgi:hypothetical protein